MTGDKKSGLEWTRKVIAEDELSRLEVDTLTLEGEALTLENMSEVSAAFAGMEPYELWQTLEAWASECDGILHQHGFPGAREFVACDDAGNWRRLKLGEMIGPDGPQRGIRGCNLVQQQAVDFSDAWYAARIGSKCRTALATRDRRKGEAWHYALVAEIFALRTDWKWRRQYKPPILTGQKVREGAMDGIKTTRKRFAPTVDNVLSAMQRHIDNGKSVSQAAELAARELNRTASANRTLYYRHHKK